MYHLHLMGCYFNLGYPCHFKQIKPKVASESKIAQMFGKQLAHENKGMSPDFGDGDYLNEEDFKALLAGMEPDQDVSKVVSHSEEPADRSSGNAILNGSSPLKEQPSRPFQDDSATPCFSPQPVKSEKENHSPQTNKEDESATSDKVRGPTTVKSSPVSTPVKPQARKVSTAVKENDLKRQRPNDTSKDTSKNAGAKQKQSNLLGFFSKQ
jgi:hypothetical protein